MSVSAHKTPLDGRLETGSEDDGVQPVICSTTPVIAGHRSMATLQHRSDGMMHSGPAVPLLVPERSQVNPSNRAIPTHPRVAPACGCGRRRSDPSRCRLSSPRARRWQSRRGNWKAGAANVAGPGAGLGCCRSGHRLAKQAEDETDGLHPERTAMAHP